MSAAQVCVHGCGADDACTAGRPPAAGGPGLSALLPAGGHRLLDAAARQLLDVMQSLNRHRGGAHACRHVTGTSLFFFTTCLSCQEATCTLKGFLSLQTSCMQRLLDSTPCWTRQIQARADLSWALRSAFLPAPASRGQ